jgi:peptide/nickel transport system ATP-binding protein
VTASAPLVEVTGLSLGFSGAGGIVHALRDVDLVIGRRRILGLVGESGSGKSTLALALLGLLPPNLAQRRGRIAIDGVEVGAGGAEAARRRRGRQVAMVFQDPMTALNPVHSIGTQLVDAQANSHPELSRAERRARAEAMLKRVGIADARARLAGYPHQMSGGMRQRVMIAMALLCEPDLLIADEPTTALDVTVEAQIAALIAGLRQDFTGSILLVSHSLGLVAELCDEVAVMYAGRVVETGPVADVFARPAHPYTAALLACEVDPEGTGRLATIPGGLPDPLTPPQDCVFAARCPHRFAACDVQPPMAPKGEARAAACWLP